VAPVANGPDVLRLLLGALTRVALAERVAILFGCVSLPGAQPARHAAALGYLRAFLVPASDWAIETIADETVTIGQDTREGGDPGLPPLLRTYLAIGARIGGHAVVDRDLDTLHVLTLLDVADMPSARLATLKALAE
jgi:putative hemolysin